MRILDIDMDYFLKEIPIMISGNSTVRISDDDYPVWSKDEVIDFFENRLGLSKEIKIKEKIVTHHNEACQSIKSGCSSEHRDDQDVLAYWKRNF